MSNPEAGIITGRICIIALGHNETLAFLWSDMGSFEPIKLL